MFNLLLLEIVGCLLKFKISISVRQVRLGQFLSEGTRTEDIITKIM